MGYFNNNTRDNNVFLCNIPVKKMMIQPLSHKAPHRLALLTYIYTIYGIYTKTYIREYAHKHTQTCPISQCNHIPFVTWFLNDLKLDFMHAFILIQSLVFFHFDRKNSENNQDLPPFSN